MKLGFKRKLCTVAFFFWHWQPLRIPLLKYQHLQLLQLGRAYFGNVGILEGSGRLGTDENTGPGDANVEELILTCKADYKAAEGCVCTLTLVSCL